MHQLKKKVWRGGRLQSSNQALEAVTLNKSLTEKKGEKRQRVVAQVVAKGKQLQSGRDNR